MARKIIFTSSEKAWLVQLIDNRILQHAQSDTATERIGKILSSIRSKLLQDVDAIYFGSYENALATGCINEQMEG